MIFNQISFQWERITHNLNRLQTSKDLIIKKKYKPESKGKTFSIKEEAEPIAETKDLVAALKASLQQSKHATRESKRM